MKLESGKGSTGSWPPLLALLCIVLAGCAARPSAPSPVGARQAPEPTPAVIADSASPTSRPSGSELDRLVASIANDQVEWMVGQFEMDRPAGKFHLAGCRAVRGTAVDTLTRGFTPTHREHPIPPASFRRRELTPALVEAIHDPKRFVAAHWILTELYGDRLREERRAAAQAATPARVFERRADASFIHRLDGLELRLELIGQPEKHSTSGGEVFEVWRCSTSADSAQITSLFERWRKRLLRD
jgi:hypothetical protein